MNTITALGLIVIAVMATALISYSVFSNDRFDSQNNPIPTATPTEMPVITEAPTASPAPTQAPELTPMPSVYIAAPAVPEFTVQLVNRSYDVAPVYRTDPYTNQTYLYSSGYHVENYTIEISIKNQQYTSVNLPDGNTTELCYAISAKGYYEDWDQSVLNGAYGYAASNSEYTVVSFVVNNYGGWNISPNGSVDIRVKAQIGYHYTYWINLMMQQTCFNSLAESAWSTTQTITGPP